MSETSSYVVTTMLHFFQFQVKSTQKCSTGTSSSETEKNPRYMQIEDKLKNV